MSKMNGYATHLPVLMAVASSTQGNIIELGAGVYSTPALHALCSGRRKLVTLEGDKQWLNQFLPLRNEWHTINEVSDYSEADELYRQDWDVAFVDHAPAERRNVELAKLTHVRYVVVHDTDECSYYNYQKSFDLFRYRLTCTMFNPWTTVLSNQDISTIKTNFKELFSL